MSTAHRWRLFDPNTLEDVAVPLNPQEFRLPDRDKNISASATVASVSGGGRVILNQGEPVAQTMGFVGVMLDRTQKAFWEYWYAKEYQVRLTDDFGDVWWIYIYKLTQTRPKTKPSHPELYRYTLDAYILDWP